MPITARSLLRHTAVYGAGNILSRAVGFVLIPIYTRYLVPDDYGALTLIDLLISIVTIFVGAQLGGAVTRFYYAYRTDRDRAEVVATALVASLASCAAAALAIGGFARPVAAALLDDPGRAAWVRLALASYVLNVNVELGLTYIRTEQRSGLFTLISLVRLLLQVALNVYFIAFARIGVAGYLWSAVISGAAILAFLLAHTARKTGIVFSTRKLVEMARYSAPFVPATLGSFVQNFGDRFFLKRFSDLAVVGVYSLGYKFGMLIVELAIQPFLRIWGVSRFEVVENEGDAPALAITGRVYTYYVAGLALFWLGVSALIDPAIRILSAAEYRSAAAYVPWITLGYGFRGLTYFYEGAAYIRKRPGVIARSNVYFALVNLALDAALIPPFSAAGATAATVLTFAGQAVYMERWNRALFPFPEERGRMLKAVAAAAAAFAAAKAVPLDSIALEFAWAVGAVLLYPVGLTVLGFWSEEEKALAGRVRARVFGRRPAAAARPAAVLEGPPDAPAG